MKQVVKQPEMVDLNTYLDWLIEKLSLLDRLELNLRRLDEKIRQEGSKR